MTTDTPLYEHDCDTCKFLGTYKHKNIHWAYEKDHTWYDLYCHSEKEAQTHDCHHRVRETIIARFGSNELDYLVTSTSCWNDPVFEPYRMKGEPWTPLNEAYERMKNVKELESDLS